MGEFIEHVKSADWKKEKHVPVLDCPDEVKAGEIFEVTASLGKEIAHPNTTEHHIRWINLYYHPDGEAAVYEVGRFEFSAHGESTKGPNEGPVSTHHQVKASLKVSQPGHLHAMAYCNIHGLWQATKQLKVS